MTGVSDTTLRALSDELIRIGRRRATEHPAMVLDASAFKILWLVVESGPHLRHDVMVAGWSAAVRARRPRVWGPRSVAVAN